MKGKGYLIFTVILALFIISGMNFGIVNDTEAFSRANANAEKGWYCSGYHNDNANHTRIVVFRDRYGNEKDRYEVQWETGKKIYDNSY
ncbi:hypothetical protein J5893_01395 [bacterium]|nr:hypothetical protein [bacterium]